jgi:YgiT-type zinc finger domain-containing protein
MKLTVGRNKLIVRLTLVRQWADQTCSFVTTVEDEFLSHHITAMICSICPIGTCHDGITEELFTKKGRLIILKNLPALICDNCSAPSCLAKTLQPPSSPTLKMPSIRQPSWR